MVSVGEAYNYTKFDKRKTIRMKDLECVLRDVDLYDFLVRSCAAMPGRERAGAPVGIRVVVTRARARS